MTNLNRRKLFKTTIHTLALLVLSLAEVGLIAQSSTKAPSPEKVTLPAGSLPIDPAKLIKSISESYYHPDDLEELDCAVTVDWSVLLSSMKVEDAENRLKILRDLRVSSRARRGKTPDITFDWTHGSLETKDQMENGFKQMIGGFYQMYWPIAASFLLQNEAEVKKIESDADGGVTIYSTGSNISLSIKADKDHLPVRYYVESPAMKGSMEPKYTTSPNPLPGDLHRLTELKATEQIGSSAMNLELSLDYQTIGGFNIPHKVIFKLGPSLSVPMEFSSCSVSKVMTVSAPDQIAPSQP